MAFTSDDVAHVYQIVGGRIIGTMPHEGKTVTSLAFSADSMYLVTGNDDHTVRVWEIGGHCVARFAQLGPVKRVAFSPTGKYLIVASEFPAISVPVDTHFLLWRSKDLTAEVCTRVDPVVRIQERIDHRPGGPDLVFSRKQRAITDHRIAEEPLVGRFLRVVG